MTTAATTELADCISTLRKAGENALTNPHVDDFLERGGIVLLHKKHTAPRRVDTTINQ